ncbi:MAG TPA: phosphatase PAP2 family protein [Micromonosporaceae bacterium]
MPARPPLALPLLCLCGFVALLAMVVAPWPPLDRFDVAVSDAFRAYGTSRPGLVAALRVATDIAATLPFLFAGLLATVLLAVRREPRAAAFCAAVTALVPTLWSLMHLLLLAPRPTDAFVVIHSNGFPSGHTTNATAAGLTAVLLLWPRVGRVGRAVAVIAAVAVAAFVGGTRIALLAHWPADVLGGWLLGCGVVPLLARAMHRWVRPSDPGSAGLSSAVGSPRRGSPPAPGSAGPALPESG